MVETTEKLDLAVGLDRVSDYSGVRASFSERSEEKGARNPEATGFLFDCEFILLDTNLCVMSYSCVGLRCTTP
jgi:hypothetical protein